MSTDIINITDNNDKICISEINENNENKICIVVLSNNGFENAVISLNVNNIIRIRDKFNLWIKQQNKESV